MENETISVHIVDDHPLFRAGLRVGLSQDPRLRVIGESGDGFEAVDRIQNDPPDVLLVDLEMPGLSGISLVSLLRRSHPDMVMLMLSGYRDSEQVRGAMEAGANGYLLKNIDVDHLAEVIHGFAEGSHVISPYLINLTVEIELGPSETGAREVAGQLGLLSPRESEVLELMIDGQSNKAIANTLHVSVETVKTHVHSILSKLQVHSRTEVIGLVSRLKRP